MNSTKTPRILWKNAQVMDVARVIRQAQLLESVKYLAAHLCVQEHDRRFLWKMFACWESHAELSNVDEKLTCELRARYPAEWGTTESRK